MFSLSCETQRLKPIGFEGDRCKQLIELYLKPLGGLKPIGFEGDRCKGKVYEDGSTEAVSS